MKISEIRFKNYKSLKKLTINLKKNSKEIKDIIAIYGENGAGKTNIADALNNLCLSLITLEAYTEWSNIIARQSQEDNEKPKISQLNKMAFFNNHRSIGNVFRNAHTIDENGISEIIYDFDINGKKGTYVIGFSEKNELIKEELEFTVTKRKGLLFEIKRDRETGDLFEKYNRVLFKDPILKSDVQKKVKSLWGKHSFLSIIKFILSDDSYDKGFVRRALSTNLIEVINEFQSILFYKRSKIVTEKTSKFKGVLSNFSNGFLKDTKYNISKIKNTEALLNEILPKLNSSVSYVKYSIEKVDETEIRYDLFLYKVIGGKNRRIKFTEESDGTKNVIEILPLLLGAIEGKIVIVDEIDNGIHDLLMEGIIQEFSGQINGQLIFTTHDTLLMKNLDKSDVYLLNVNADGYKEIYSLDEFSIKNSDKQNKTKQYLEGKFDAIPYIDQIDFNCVKSFLNGEEAL